MESLQERMFKNCRQEARLMVRNPNYVLPARNEEFTRIRQAMIEEEKAIYDAELAANERAQIQMLKDRMSQEFGEDWMEWAKSLYIDNGSKIISAARPWKEEVSWDYANELEKLQKIEQLIRYKIRDRLRGRGSIDQDLNQ